jgi:hypothetical protein
MTLVIATDILKFPSLQIILNTYNASWKSSVVAISADYQQRKP